MNVKPIFMTRRSRILLMTLVIVAGAAAAFAAWRTFSNPSRSPNGSAPTEALPEAVADTAVFGESVTYEAPGVKIDPAIAKDFDASEIINLQAMESAYGFTFTPAERRALTERKFVMKNLLDTNIRPSSSGDNVREFAQLYSQLEGPRDYKARGPQNAMFFSSDVFLNAYGNLYTELLKEMENKEFYPAMKSLSEKMYEAAAAKLAKASSSEDKRTWSKVRDYFAVPYAIFSTAAQPLTQADYYKDYVMRDPAQVMAEYDASDAKVDTYENVAAFVRKLDLGADSENAVLADLKTAYDAKGKGTPAVFEDEYNAYTRQEKIGFAVDFTQFTPRGTYTSSSLRRQYFRGMKWFIQVPFFLKSADLTTYAFAASQLLAEQPEALKDYDKLEKAIDFMVGTSDDLMPVDYLQALVSGKGASDQSAAAMEYLVKARDPKIKDLAASYSAVGVEQSDDVRLKTKGMRFFSGKFIIDSYWTGYLTQGDEALRPGYPQKLPPMASALEVMTLLGSDYAKSQIPKLDFYAPSNAQAIEKALGELKVQEDTLTDADWRRNLYNSWLWTIRSLFSWQTAHQAELPRFMQSLAWEAKTLMTASASWTELRHAAILYAKQSFAELGGGGPGDACDPRQVPPPPKGYIEPQIEAYARLRYLAKRTDQGLKDQGYQLNNMAPLENFINMLDLVQGYVGKELANETLKEQVTKSTRPDAYDPTKTCVEYFIDEESDWEQLRLAVVDGLKASIPVPTEGPILSAKDRRAALVADVHTGGDSSYPTRILYEGTGVPYVIFVAVKDANGPRLTAGFTSSQYEFTKPYGGQRLTDEEWQGNFYVGDEPYNAYTYAEKSKWPQTNVWYAPLFDLK